MLLGARLNVFTDHKHLTHQLSSFTTQQVLRWKILLKEYNPTYHYLPGPENNVADSLSRTPTATLFAESDTSHLNQNPDTDVFTFHELAESLLALPTCNAQTDSHHVEDIFLFHPKFDPRGRHPFHFDTIYHYQQESSTLNDLLKTSPDRYFTKVLKTGIVPNCPYFGYNALPS